MHLPLRPRSIAVVALFSLPILSFVTPRAASAPETILSDHEQPQALDPRFHDQLEVRLVMLHATVLNRRGETVRGLGPADFRLEEDGVRQEITVFGSDDDQPLKVAFLLDVSGSMALGGKLDRARDAIHRCVESLRPDDEVALLIFADGDVVVRKGFSTDRAPFLESLDGIVAYGRTALHSALAKAPTLLAEAAPGRKALVLLTDGIDNASTISAAESLQLARRVPVPIYAVGIHDLPEAYMERPDDRRGPGTRTIFDVLRELAEGTGGDLVPAYAPEDIEAAVSRIEERLRAQYVIGYKPSRPPAPGFRRVALVAVNRRYEVQTRKGYVVIP
jgi:Ca-activated chloride channel homolog